MGCCFPKMAADLPYTEDDIQRMLACQVHLGTKNCDFQMEKYTYKRRANDGVYIFDLSKTWEKLTCCPRCRRNREPTGCVRHRRPSIWRTCCAQVRSVHWRPIHRRPLHSWYLHQLHQQEVHGATSSRLDRPTH